MRAEPQVCVYGQGLGTVGLTRARGTQVCLYDQGLGTVSLARARGTRGR
ncbi:hypothetical protein ACIRPP_00980 [Streptomyces sp. NPDC101219]